MPSERARAAIRSAYGKSTASGMVFSRIWTHTAPAKRGELEHPLGVVVCAELAREQHAQAPLGARRAEPRHERAFEFVRVIPDPFEDRRVARAQLHALLKHPEPLLRPASRWLGRDHADRRGGIPNHS